MKEININKKQNVIKLLFSGLAYDDIASDVGVAKGSVVNIIEEFKGGKLLVPPNMSGYLDELRHLVVDMKKHNTTINQLKSYNTLYNKMKEMDVGIDQIDQWLDICQDISTETVTNSKFVESALQLAQLKVTTGHDPESVVAEFHNKYEAVKKLKAEIKQANQGKKELTGELTVIKEEITAAQEEFDSQTKDLQLKLDEYMIQNHLSWDQVNKALAIFSDGLVKIGFNEVKMEAISQQVVQVGSLITYLKELEENKKVLEAEYEDLNEKYQQLEIANAASTKMYDALALKVLGIMESINKIEPQLEDKKAELVKLIEATEGYKNDIYTAYLILAFLMSPKDINDHDFDQLVELMIGLRQIRLGIGPKKVLDTNGDVICECKVPLPYGPIEEYSSGMDEARERLALCLVPLLKGKFVPYYEYEVAKATQKMLNNMVFGYPDADDTTKDTQ